MVLNNSKTLLSDMPEAPKSSNVTDSMLGIIQGVKETLWTKPVVFGSLTVLAITGICLTVYWNNKDDDGNTRRFKWPWTNNQDGSNKSE